VNEKTVEHANRDQHDDKGHDGQRNQMAQEQVPGFPSVVKHRTYLKQAGQIPPESDLGMRKPVSSKQELHLFPQASLRAALSVGYSISR